MLSLHIIAAGKLKAGPAYDLFQNYQQRLKSGARPVGIEGLKLHEIEAPKNLTGQAHRDKEAELLLNAAPSGACFIVLDERGKSLTSQALAETIAKVRDEGCRDMAFLIGGADGHGTEVQDIIRKNRVRTLSFGLNTWPHMLVRIMLAEQLYRATSILSGHPYHRE